ncbi:hypothetical protein EON65_26410 [archaeon]|nr:MAG: hypothetical protein EON65_26410 [archaeon]
MDKYLRDYDTLLARTTKLSEDLDHQETANKKLVLNINNLEKEMKLKHIEIGRLNTEKGLLERKVR